MSYTGSHASNFVTAPTSTSAASPPVLPDRREVRPLAAANHSSGGSGTAGSMTQKQAHTANLEAQVRMLEQEVHLLRDGLAQNERLRAVSPSKRVHFGPSSVVAIPPSSSSAAVAQRRASASSSTRPAAGQPSPTERQATLYGQDGRPRLAFGQRVDPSRPRHSSTTRTVKPTGADTSYHVSAAAAVSSGAPPAHTLSSTTVSSTAGYDGRATLPPAVPSTVRGSNASGIPLQGAAAGATVVAALEAGGVPSAAAAAAPPATVWASANPALLWTRAASMADANSGSRGAGGAELIASYPFRTPAAEAATPPALKVPPAATTAATVGVVPPAAAAAAAAPSSSPIVVTMSSEGWPGGVVASRVVPAGPPDSLSPSAATAALPPSPPAAAAPTPGPAAGAATAAASIPVTPAASAAMPPAAEVTVSTHANPAQPAPSPGPTPIAPDTTVGELRHQIALLRDTLEQREALLHRVLMELHSRPDATRTPAGAAGRVDLRRPSLGDERDEHNRRTLRLLTQELLAAQTQLSHARVSYQLLFDEIQRRPAVPPQQPAASAAVHDAPAPPAPTPASPPAPVPVVPPPAPPTPDVQAKLEAALKKVAAWEDWYATTHRDDENKEREEGAAGAAPDTAAPASAAVESEKTQTNAKKKKKKHHATHGNNEETNGAGYSGFYPPGVGSPPSVSAATVPGLHAAAPLHRSSCGPYQSAYAMDDLLYNQLASNSYAGAALHTSASTAAAASGGGGNGQQERHPSVATAGTAAPPPKATSPAPRGQPSTPPQQQQQQQPDASPLYKNAMSALAPVPSNLCDDLDHARLQAYRDQQYMAQFARGAAVRELAEAERRVAEERLALYRERERHATPPPAAAGTTATPPAASAGRREDAAEGNVPKTQETVDDK